MSAAPVPAGRVGLPRPILIALAIAGVALLLAAPFLVKNYRVFQFNLVLIYAVAILGLNILTGYNGQFSLGHSAFYALGAYCAAIMMDRYGLPYWSTLLPAAVYAPKA